jgi:Leucine-rich repeat (LRR) protein
LASGGYYLSHLSGALDPIYNLHSLVTLCLLHYQLTGSISSDIGKLTALENIDFGLNGLTGTIPPQLERLTALTSLSIHGNQLNGTIPSQLGQLTHLTALNFDENKLTGTLPSELGRLHELQSLHLRRNQLRGTIPSQIGQMKALTAIVVWGNHLTGRVPSLPFKQYTSCCIEGEGKTSNNFTCPLPTDATDCKCDGGVPGLVCNKEQQR